MKWYYFTEQQKPKSNFGMQGWQYGTVRYVGTVRYASIFVKKYDTLVRYAFFVMVWVRYVGRLFELKMPDFLHIAPDFCMQRQKIAAADAKCVNLVIMTK